MNIIKKQQNYKVLFIIGIILIVFFSLIYFLNLSKKVEVEKISVANFDNLKELVGTSDNIFIGKVMENLGSSKKPIKNTKGNDFIVSGILYTTFDVEVISNIKGKASKKIKLLEGGGYNGKKYFNKHGLDSLKEGKIYLFTTTHLKDNLYGILGHKNAMIKLTKEDLKDLNKSKKVLEFKKAYVNEITFDSTIEFKNAFKKLPKSEKEKLKKEVLKSEFGGEVRK